MTRARILVLLATLLAATVLPGCASAPDEAAPGDGPPGLAPPTGGLAGPGSPPTGPTSPTTPPTSPTDPGAGAPPNASRAFRLERAIGGLDRPLFLGHAGDGSGRLFVVEKTGLVRVWKPGAGGGALLDAPFLDVRGKIVWGGEQGLLGIAFHPRFRENGLAFVTYTAKDSSVVLERYRVDAANADRLDPASAKTLLRVPKPHPTHNAGMVAFGPDGYLYVSLGDGGGAGDPERNAQNLGTLLGSILRLDVDAGDPYAIPPANPFVGKPGARGEIWAFGLRNPWRFTFDRATGDLWIADVGQNKLEEINFQPASSDGGENYGWSLFEGSQRFRDGAPASEPVPPVSEFGHDVGCAVAGGYVYRGSAIPGLRGTYLYSDLCSGTIWGVTRDAGGAWRTETLADSEHRIVSFGEDAAGELYVLNHDGDGAAYKLVPA